MAVILNEEYVTIPEAAKLLQVHPSSIRRWIDAGDLPAHRVGQRRVLVKGADLAKLITPARGEHETRDRIVKTERSILRSVPPEQQGLTPHERQQMLAAIERAKQLQVKLLEQRGGKPFSPSWELLNKARDERTRDLP